MPRQSIPSPAKFPSWLQDCAFSLLAFGLPLAVYLRTLAPTVYGLDSAELATGAYTLGIVHAPGSPLYLLLAHLFTYIPVGDIGYRVNLFSAITAAGTVLNIYWILRRLQSSPSLALLAAWFMGFTYYFWIVALFAELYALQGWFVTILLLAALDWRRNSKPWQLLLFCLLFGLGLGNHLSLIMLAPGYAILLAGSRPRPWQQPRLLALAAICGALGSLIYLYLPIRYAADPPLNYVRDYWKADLTTWDGFWWMVSGQMFIQDLWAAPGVRLPMEIGRYLYQLWSNFLGVGLWVGLAGLAADFRRRPGLHAALLSMLAGHLAFYIPYHVVDKALMWLPTYIVWGLWIGIGLERAEKWLLSQKRGLHPSGRQLALGLAALSGVVALLWVNFPLVDLSRDTSARRVGESILATLPPGAAFFGNWADVPVIEYLQLVEQQRPDIVRFNIIAMKAEQIRQTALQMLERAQPVYTSQKEWFTGFQSVKITGCDCYQIVYPAP